MNIVTEPRENDDYTVPCYSFMKPGLWRASVALRNLTHKTIELKKGNIVASVQAANAIPLMLASKSPEDSNISKNNSSLTPEATPERIEKLFSKLDLSGADKWAEENKVKMRGLFKRYHHLFALED